MIATAKPSPWYYIYKGVLIKERKPLSVGDCTTIILNNAPVLAHVLYCNAYILHVQVLQFADNADANFGMLTVKWEDTKGVVRF